MRHPELIPLLAVGVLAALGAAWQGPDYPGALASRPPGKVAPSGPVPRPAARASSAFQLFASYRYGLVLDANRVQCSVNNIGDLCVNSNGIYGGAYWPRYTNDQYIFDGGLLVAATIPGNRASFAWAGDTVGAFFYDETGNKRAGEALAGLYDSRDTTDLARWPSAAYVRDTTFFDASLIGREAASEQDSWARYWDGNIHVTVGRPHPMGILVDQRTLAWNRPEAGRDILFVIVRLINVTARDATRYAGLAAYGYTPEAIADLAKIGAGFHARADSLGMSLPDSGFTWTNLYVGLGQDPDVTASGAAFNYSTAVLPFATTVAYKADFLAEAYWTYPPDIFVPPFARAPGLTGTKFLRVASGPVTGSSAIRMFTNTGGGMFSHAPNNVAQLWGIMSNHMPSYLSCNAPGGTPLCLLIQTSDDTRWYMSSGPWPDVPGGQSVAFAYAYVFAAPLSAPLQTDGRGNALGSASFDLKPGTPATGLRLAAGTDTVRQIERVAGWTSFTDRNGNGDIEQAEVQVQPYSLLGKAAAAQALADAKFLLPSPPAAPRFYPLPGDGQVTVVWERSATEVTGDPYFAVAANPLSGAYDPNFRQLDVEGYRVWRGTSLSSMQLVAQYDYTGTTFVDHTGQIFSQYEQVGQCAPDLGIVTACPVNFLNGQSRSLAIAGALVQVPPQGRVRLDDGRVLVLRADTLVSGGRSGLPVLQDTGVPFAFVDTGVRNGTTYVYAVTAFDVNSVNSGASSYQSEMVGKTVTPRIASSNVHGAVVATGMYGGDGTRLDPNKAFPAINAADGTFSGPIPPANGGSIELVQAVPELLPPGEFTLRVDSVSPGFPDGSGLGPMPKMYFSVVGGPLTLHDSVEIPAPSSLDPYWSRGYEYAGPFVPYDSAQARRFGVALASDARMPVRFLGTASSVGASSVGVARAAYLGYVGGNATRWLSHSRWFDEQARVEPPNPTIDPFGSASHTNGALSNVTAIYSPLPYRLPIGGGAGRQGIPTTGYRNLLSAAVAAWYPADLVVRWGSGGQVTVRDSTHRLDLPYKGAVQPGYGFLNASALVAAGVTSSQLSDGSSGVTFDPSVVSYYSLKTVRPMCGVTGSTVPCVALQPTAQLQPVDITNDGVSDGTGIALLINGEPFYMLMGALPAPGTAWHLRAVTGDMAATCSPSLPDPASTDLLPGAQPTTCSGYSFRPSQWRPAYAPGLRYTLSVTRQFGPDTTSGDLGRVHTVPDPLYYTIVAGAYPQIRFVNLPERAIIRIYSTSGILVALLTHNDPTAGGELVWDVTNRNGRYVASGVYFYHVETADRRVKIGRFTVVQQKWPR